MISEVLKIQRRNFQLCTQLSNNIGNLMRDDGSDPERIKQVYESICNAYGRGSSKSSNGKKDEITVDAFIRITTQEFSNINTFIITKTIQDFDEDEDGII